jgi:hypothetical protein
MRLLARISVTASLIGLLACLGGCGGGDADESESPQNPPVSCVTNPKACQ